MSICLNFAQHTLYIPVYICIYLVLSSWGPFKENFSVPDDITSLDNDTCIHCNTNWRRRRNSMQTNFQFRGVHLEMQQEAWIVAGSLNSSAGSWPSKASPESGKCMHEQKGILRNTICARYRSRLYSIRTILDIIRLGLDCLRARKESIRTRLDSIKTRLDICLI